MEVGTEGGREGQREVGGTGRQRQGWLHWRQGKGQE